MANKVFTGFPDTVKLVRLAGNTVDFNPPRVNIGANVPYVIGKELIKSPSMLWYGNAKPISQTTATTSSTIDEDGNEVVTYTTVVDIVGYSLDMQLALCLGPNVKLRAVYIGKDVVWSGSIGPARTEFTAGDYSMVFSGGNYDQVPDPYLDAHIQEQLPGYVGIAHVIIKSVDTANLPTFSFEVERITDLLGLGAKNVINGDINVVSAIADVITNIRGGAGKDISIIDMVNLKTIGNILYDENQGCSYINDNAVTANNIIDELCAQIDALIFVNPATNKIQMNLIRKNFNRGTLLNLYDKDIVNITSLEKNTWPTVATAISLSYTDRANKYITMPILSQNLSSIFKQSNNTIKLNYPSVMNGDLAAEILSREMAKKASPVQTVNITVNRKGANILPGQIILLTVSKYKYYTVALIVIKRRTQPIDNNTVTLLCQFVLYPNNNVLFEQPDPGFFIPFDNSPHAPADVKAFNTPFFLRNTQNVRYYDILTREIIEVPNDAPLFAMKPYNKFQLYANAMLEIGGTYSLMTLGDSPTIPQLSEIPRATLKTVIDKYDGWTTGLIDIAVDNLFDAAAFIASLQTDVNLYGRVKGYIIIDNEYIGFQKDSVFTYNDVIGELTVTKCTRGMIDTVAENHASGATAYFLWTPLPLKWPQYFITQTAFPVGNNPHFKFVSWAKVKGALQQSKIEAGFPVDTWVASDRANRPYRPHNTKINGVRSSTPIELGLADAATVTWAIRSRVPNVPGLETADVLFYPLEQWRENEPSEISPAGKEIAYRVIIEDSALTSWDCGVTDNTVALDTLAITVPPLAALGNGWLYVQAEMTMPSGLKKSQFQDRIPIILTA